MKTKKRHHQKTQKGFKTEASRLNEVTSLVSFGFLFLTSLKAMAGVPSGGLPQGYKAVSGDVQFQENKNTLNVNSGSDRAIVEYNSFSVGQNASVNFNLPSSRSAILNRVTGGSASEIMGKINSNGQVFLVNPNGIIFGTTAQVNVSSLIASTLDITNQDFLKGNLVFENKGFKAAGINNQGKISIVKGGSAVLIGGAIANKGSINAPSGQIHLVVGDKISVSASDGIIMDVTVDRELKESVENFSEAISNSGTLTADQLVKMQAKVSNNVYDTIINNDGVIRANGISDSNGTIELTAQGNAGIKIGGKLQTDSLKVQNDGDILVSDSKNSLSEIANLGNGDIELISRSGNVTINDRLVVNDKGKILLSAQNINLDSASDSIDELLRSEEGSISLKAASSINVKDKIKSSSGNIELLAFKNINVSDKNSKNSTLISTTGQGSVNLNSTGDIAVGDSVTTQYGKIEVTSQKGNISINDSSETTNTLLRSTATGAVDLTAEAGDINLNDTVQTSRGNITIKAGGSINVSDEQSKNSKLISADYGSNVTLTADNEININDQISTRDGEINLQSKTVKVQDQTDSTLLSSTRGNINIKGEEGKIVFKDSVAKTKYGKVNIIESAPEKSSKEIEAKQIKQQELQDQLLKDQQLKEQQIKDEQIKQQELQDQLLK
ncbi:MAG: filamentous hemagglutinin N-terminal domain-containing protein, partial [Candidatus Caenarcaniphilales bacterium]|nr:filamentous hemagglutinin N-terminal domain-containing protein [Candidatus Caenarcaniphilales bacterium]